MSVAVIPSPHEAAHDLSKVRIELGRSLREMIEDRPPALKQKQEYTPRLR